MKILLASLLALTPVSASATDVIRWETTSQTCWRNVYREEYVPGTYNVVVSSKLLSKFTSEDYDLTYYIALEPDSIIE